ncbi:protein phosphatase 2C 77-like [Tripterygium wilfordii]|uniref:Protein phosphatase 2C 77-like n=1 Tax=Tripterygium wilfordii TaxID=458696 RepID=A0A7J7BX13_TRIWF|nr:protein phosphatase 2C 77-like [Tripterygium wilfordii]
MRDSPLRLSLFTNAASYQVDRNEPPIAVLQLWFSHNEFRCVDVYMSFDEQGSLIRLMSPFPANNEGDQDGRPQSGSSRDYQYLLDAKDGGGAILSNMVTEGENRLEKISRIGGQSVFEFDSVALWGCISICGKRPAMEGAVAAIPQFSQIPAEMLMDDRVFNVMKWDSSNLASHFFLLYDGHGGCQDECRILASDGLWDVVTNEQACDIAWRRILFWHKKPPPQKGATE